MRDLAQQSYRGTQSGKIAIPQSTIKIVLVLIVVLAILFVVKRFIDTGTVGGSSIVLRDAPKGLTPVEVSGEVDITEDAVNLAVESASFTNVSGESASATASRRHGDGSFSMSVNATLPDPKGNKYQVWIVGGGVQILAGDMGGSGKSWSLTFNDVDEYSDMNEVWITKEVTNNDDRPEVHILEGSF